jgi:hypothetical protein
MQKQTIERDKACQTAAMVAWTCAGKSLHNGARLSLGMEDLFLAE